MNEPAPSTAPEPRPGHAARVARLHQVVDALGSVAVAFSAGIDSTLVLKVCRDRLGDAAAAVIGVSPSLPPGELEEARHLAEHVGVLLHEVETTELEDEHYVANPENRCYWCRADLYRHVHRFAAERGLAAVVDGQHAGDRGDWRPGAQAADEAGVHHPLVEAEFDKDDIRVLARHLGLPNWDKPALACLSSRIPYGTAIDATALQRIGQAEQVLRRLGFTQCRVRDHGDVARIEVPPQDLERALSHRDELVEGITSAGFPYVALDLRGYRTGAMNEVRGDP